MLAWKKKSAYYRAQRVSVVFERRGLKEEAERWQGWRLGNLAPMFEPIAWLTKPYCIGGTIADNVLEHGVGAINADSCRNHGVGATNILEFAFAKDEERFHEAQKPLGLISCLIDLTTQEGQTVLDPFSGSGTTAVAAKRLNRRFIGFEAVSEFHEAACHRLQNERDGSVAAPSSQASLI